jgi:PilZ domain
MSPRPPISRFEKRIARAVTVELSRIDTSLFKEMAVTENVSPRGLRLATGHEWMPGDRVLVICTEDAVWSQARVIYCKRLKEVRFAVGLELLNRVDQWAPSQRTT